MIGSLQPILIPFGLEQAPATVDGTPPIAWSVTIKAAQETGIAAKPGLGLEVMVDKVEIYRLANTLQCRTPAG